MSEPIILDYPKDLTIDPSNVSVGLTSEQPLIDLIKLVLENNYVKHETLIKLSANDCELINNIMASSPASLTDIETSIKEVIKDGEIDTKDVPRLIIIIQVLYRLIYSIKNRKLDSKKRAESTANVFKFIIHLLILERKIVIEDEKRVDFLKDVDILIDTCVELLCLSKMVKTKTCLKKLFG